MTEQHAPSSTRTGEARVLFIFLAWVLTCLAAAQMPQVDNLMRHAIDKPHGTPPTIPDLPPERAFDFTADESERNGEDVHLKGQVTIKFREYTAVCDEAIGNTRTRIFDLRGNVQVFGPEMNYVGDAVIANFKDKTVEFTNARTVMKPGAIKNGLQDDLYIHAGSGHGSEKRYVLENGDCTTCDLPTPHYHISAKNIEIIKDDRIIMRDARLVVKGKTILRIPYLSLPLDENLPRYLPEIGKSQDEGLFIKTRWGIGIPGDDLLDAKVDLMSKLGVGLGAELKYRDTIMKGTAKIYNVFGPENTRTASIEHLQQLGHGVLTVSGNIGNQNYLTAPQNEIINVRGIYAFPFLGGRTRFTMGHQSNKSGNFQSTSQVATLRDEREWRGGLRTTLDFNLSSYYSRSGAFSQDRKVIDINAMATKRFASLDAELAYQRSVPISEIVNFFSATDRTPLLTLRSDFNRMLNRKSSGPFNIMTEFTVGELVDAVKHVPVGRTTMELIVPQQTLASGRHALRLAGRFKQGFYSDNTAQFIFGADGNYSYSFGQDSSINLRYNYLRPQGYTPLQLDRAGRTDLFGSDISFRLHPTLLIAAQSGYDLLARERSLSSSWQNVGARLEWRPSERFLFRSSATYDTLGRLWNNVRMDLLAYQTDTTKFYLGARYDGTRSQFGAVNFIAEGMRWGKLTAGLLLSWNGYTKDFETRQMSLMYDLHDADALLEITENRTGFRNGTSVAFFIRLKAMPFLTPFGKGTRGQGFGTGTGVNF